MPSYVLDSVMILGIRIKYIDLRRVSLVISVDQQTFRFTFLFTTFVKVEYQDHDDLLCF